MLFAAIVGGTAWGANAYLNTTAYLAAQDGKVAIYRGVPGTLLGLSFSHLERATDVSVNDLQPGTANRLARRHPALTPWTPPRRWCGSTRAEAAPKGSSEGAGEGGKATGGQDGADNGGTSDNGGGSDNAASGSSSANGSNGSASQGGAA